MVVKIYMACQEVPAYRTAVLNSREDLSQLTNKLQSLIIIWEKEHPSQGVYTTSFMNCLYDKGVG